jgi:transcriptional regulator with XRE-family HTH domain
MDCGDTDRLVARRLARIRAARGLTLDGLAQLSGVSRAMISRVERGEASPTAQLLGRLSSALGMTLSSFFADEAAETPLVRAGDRPVWRDPATGYTRRDVAPRASATDLVDVTLPPGAKVDYANHIPLDVEQLVWVLDGRLRLTVAGDSHDLASGDCLTMRLDQPISYENLSAAPVRYAVVLASRHLKSGRNT